MGNQICLLLIICASIVSCSKRKNQNDVSGSVETQNIEEITTMADSFYIAKRYNEAINLFDKIIESNDSVHLGEYYYKRAYSLVQLSDHIKSSDDLHMAIRFKYREADAFYMLGLNAIIVSGDSLAIIYFKESLKLNPNYKEVIEILNACQNRSKEI